MLTDREIMRRLVEMADHLWHGDPELISDRHWEAYNESLARLGLMEDEEE